MDINGLLSLLWLLIGLDIFRRGEGSKGINVGYLFPSFPFCEVTLNWLPPTTQVIPSDALVNG